MNEFAEPRPALEPWRPFDYILHYAAHTWRSMWRPDARASAEWATLALVQLRDKEGLVRK